MTIAHPLPAAPTKRPPQRKQRPRARRLPQVGDLRPGDKFWWAGGYRLKIVAIEPLGYGHRKGATYHRLRIIGLIRGNETVVAYYASDEHVEQ